MKLPNTRAGQILSETVVPRWFWPLKNCTAPRGVLPIPRVGTNFWPKIGITFESGINSQKLGPKIGITENWDDQKLGWPKIGITFEPGINSPCNSYYFYF